jgi:hypothetical protein
MQTRLPSQERSKWERVLQSSEEAGHAASQQVQELTRQVAELRRRAEEAEDKLTGRDAEITRVRLECLDREKAAVRRAKDEFELALQAERRASEEAIQVSGSLAFPCDAVWHMPKRKAFYHTQEPSTDWG